MAVFCFGLPRIVLQKILTSYLTSNDYTNEELEVYFGKKPLTILPDDDAELLGSRAKEFGRVTLTRRQRENILKKMPLMLREPIESLWPYKYTLYMDEEHGTFFKFEEVDNVDITIGLSLQWSVFYSRKSLRKSKPLEELVYRVDGLPTLDQEIILVSVDDKTKQQHRFKVDSIGQLVTSTAIVYLTKIH